MLYINNSQFFPQNVLECSVRFAQYGNKISLYSICWFSFIMEAPHVLCNPTLYTTLYNFICRSGQKESCPDTGSIGSSIIHEVLLYKQLIWLMIQRMRRLEVRPCSLNFRIFQVKCSVEDKYGTWHADWLCRRSAPGLEIVRTWLLLTPVERCMNYLHRVL